MHPYILNFRKLFLKNKNSRKYLTPLINLYHQLQGSKKIISRGDLNTIVNNYSIITKNSLDFTKSGNEITEIKTNISSDIPSILGWVPLINNKTSIVVYHFLSTNSLIYRLFSSANSVSPCIVHASRIPLCNSSAMFLDFCSHELHHFSYHHNSVAFFLFF